MGRIKYLNLLQPETNLSETTVRSGYLVTISGVIKNFDNQVELFNESEIGDLMLPARNVFFLPDSAGNFSLTLSLERPDYYRLGRNILYLSPGDSLNVLIDLKYPQKAIFEGKGADANEYLKTIPSPQSGSFLEGGVKAGIKETINYVLSEERSRIENLKSFKSIPSEFREFEMARIKADCLNSLLLLEGVYPIFHKLSDTDLAIFKREYDEQVLPFLKKYAAGFLNSEYLKLEAYRWVLGFLIHNKSENPVGFDKIEDWLKARRLVKEMQKVKSREDLLSFEDRIVSISTHLYRTVAGETWKTILKFGRGDMASNFSARDIDGNLISLNSYAGKIIFISLWATWCGPCLKELPYFDELRRHFGGYPDIVFLHLSIDKNRETWRRYVIDEKLQGLQLNVSSDAMLEYRIGGIPRTIVIDKDFKVYDMHGPQPSDKKILLYLNDLIN